MRTALPREEVVKAVEHRGPVRVPMMIHRWNDPGEFGDRAGEVEALRAAYPCDAYWFQPRIPPVWDDPSREDYLEGWSWLPHPPPERAESVGHDAAGGIADWAQLDEVLDAWPDAARPEALGGATKAGVAEAAQGRYTVFHWWYGFYERLWSLRGMAETLMDFHLHPGPVHRLLDAMADFYEGWIRRAGREIGPDAVWITDDIGMQTGPMFSPEVFRTFFKERYRRLATAAHESGMHVWLHTCGDIRMFLDELIEVGFDVIHPVQKYAMDERAVAERFGGRVAFWAGMDVQKILPEGTPEEVRAEVRHLVDTFDRPDGGCMITAGNMITGDVPLENLAAFYDETHRYGTEHRSRPCPRSTA